MPTPKKTTDFNNSAEKAKAKNLSKMLHSLLQFFAGELQAVTLIEQGADINLRDKEGNSPIVTAVATNKEIAVRVLIEKGADASAKNAKGVSCLQLAVLNGHRKITELLVNSGARLSAVELVEIAAAAAEKQDNKTLDCLRLAAQKQDGVEATAIAAPKLKK